MDTDILLTLSSRPADKIEPSEILALIELIKDRGASEIVTRVL